MCTNSLPVEDFPLIAAGRQAAEDVLARCFRVDLSKAMDLGSTRGFDRAVGKLATQLRSRANASDEAAVRAAVGVLDIDWHGTTASQRRSLIARALQAAGRKTAGVPGKVQAVFGEAASEVVQATRQGARAKQGLAIAADFNALDRRIIKHLTSTQANFVRGEYGRRHDAFGEEARHIVAEGLEAGLGRDDIARDLERAAKGVIAGRSSFYWDVVAGAFVSNGRSFAQVSAYAEAGIQRYVIEAVLDEVTTNTCRFLHGKTFSVGDAVRRFERIESLEQPEDIKTTQPWVRESRDPETGRTVLYVNKGSRRVPITEVVRSGLGAKDDTGEFRRSTGDQALMDIGLSFPPYHGLCRSQTLGIT